MKKKEEFLQSGILLLILLAVASFSSENPYLCFVATGVLMLIFTWRSLSEEPGRLFLAVQFLGSVLFAAFAGGVAPFLIFCECRVEKWRMARLFFLVLGYLVYESVGGIESLPHTICNMLILLVMAGGILLVEKLVSGYLSVKEQTVSTVTITAVNEMYEKKLNRELTIKNYLVDKNARLEERENISRTIHNSVGHSITAAIMTLDAAEMLFDTAPDKAREKMNTANQRIRTSLSEIRHAVRVLDSESQFISMSDFMDVLRTVLDSFVMDTTIEIRTDFGNVNADLSIPREHGEFLTGAVQELLTNGVRHGNADLFGIHLIGDSGHIMLRLWDNGKSDFSGENEQEKIRNGFGLKKLISYVKRCGGSVTFANENGFKTELVLPLYEEADNE